MIVAVVARQAVERADRAAATTIEHLRVDHCRPDVRMAEQFLHGADVVTRLEQGGGGWRWQRALERLIADVMAAHDASARIDRTTVGRKYILPAPVARSAGIFAPPAVA